MRRRNFLGAVALRADSGPPDRDVVTVDGRVVPIAEFRIVVDDSGCRSASATVPFQPARAVLTSRGTGGPLLVTIADPGAGYAALPARITIPRPRIQL